MKGLFEEAALRGSLEKFVVKAGKEKDPMVFLRKNRGKLEDRLNKEIPK